MKREIRSLGSVERRADGEIKKIGGYAAIFDSDAEIGGYFVERIARGAFARAIGRDDVRCLFNHHDRFVIGRSKAGTLRLSEDERGLVYEADPPDTTWARDLVASIERGDITQSSFAFRATKEQWDETGPLPVRTILECELYDVSPVTYPAYEDTEVGVRAQAVLGEARSAGLLVAPPAFNPHAAKLRMRASLDVRTRTRSRL